MTLGEKFDSANGRPAGFDYLRIGLALAVVVWHTVGVTYGGKVEARVWREPVSHHLLLIILPAFFALSGFLVAGSLERCKTLAGFLYLRVIRIFPALMVEVTISAVILGPLMTQFRLADYFHDTMLYQYLLNMVGYIHYNLPGLFLQNPLPKIVNSQLWTIPFELECYIILGVLGILGISHQKWLFFLCVVAFFVSPSYHFIEGVDRNAGLTGNDLVCAFLFGVLFYNFRSRIPHSRWIAGISLAATLYLLGLPNGNLVAPLPIAYLTVFLGLTNPGKLYVLQTGDYSYGVYLYGFPIQQAVVATKCLPLNGWVNLAVSLPIILLVAFCSWHLWEKRMLGLRVFRPAIDRWFSVTGPGLVVKRIYRLAVPAKV